MTDRATKVDRVRALLASHDSQSGSNQGWDDAWKEGMTPWDSGEPQDALVSVWELDEVSQQLPKAGHALVSGCGRGYDALFFAQQGFAGVLEARQDDITCKPSPFCASNERLICSHHSLSRYCF